MKTFGILGGISPQATMDFEKRIHEVSQRIIPQHGNSGYPPMLVYYHRRPPVVTKDGISPVLPIQADPELLGAARWLGTKADFLVITSNGAHVLQQELEGVSGLKILSIVEQTLNEVKKRGWKKVGALGFPMESVPIYTKLLSELGFTVELIDAELQTRLNAAIMALMEGRVFDNTAEDAVAVLRQRGVDGIILGCTEIPLLLGNPDEPDLISPLALLAEATVKFAIASYQPDVDEQDGIEPPVLY
jgi:aspartate racemase